MAPKQRLTPAALDAIRAVAHYVLDRAKQYDESSGIHDVLCTTGAEILRGEVEERWFAGELDDHELLAWQARILDAKPKECP